MSLRVRGDKAALLRLLNAVCGCTWLRGKKTRAAFDTQEAYDVYSSRFERRLRRQEGRAAGSSEADQPFPSRTTTDANAKSSQSTRAPGGCRHATAGAHNAHGGADAGAAADGRGRGAARPRRRRPLAAGGARAGTWDFKKRRRPRWADASGASFGEPFGERLHPDDRAWHVLDAFDAWPLFHAFGRKSKLHGPYWERFTPPPPPPPRPDAWHHAQQQRWAWERARGGGGGDASDAFAGAAAAWQATAARPAWWATWAKTRASAASSSSSSSTSTSTGSTYKAPPRASGSVACSVTRAHLSSLGLTSVPTDAAGLKKAYLESVKLWHPDAQRGAAAASAAAAAADRGERFRGVQEAYTYLRARV